MERDPDGDGGSASCTSSGKSKLDNLSKEDLIKFAKKQMVAFQKLKSKCSDLEKEAESLRAVPVQVSDDPVIQELTARLDAVLLEKAEAQQSLVSLRKENEALKKQGEENLASLQKKLIEELNVNLEAVREENEHKLRVLMEDMQSSKSEWAAETEALRKSHQRTVLKAQEELEGLQNEMTLLIQRHEEEVHALEEQLECNAVHFALERERLLALQDEPPEEEALTESYLQDVQEEEEEHTRNEVRRASAGEEAGDELQRLRTMLRETESQNTMLQEEVTFLHNVKLELESELSHVRKEFRMEREEFEFKINEMQMMREDGDGGQGGTRTVPVEQDGLYGVEQEENKGSRDGDDLQGGRAEVTETSSGNEDAPVNQKVQLQGQNSDRVEDLHQVDSVIRGLRCLAQAADELKDENEVALRLLDLSMALKEALKGKEDIGSCISHLKDLLPKHSHNRVDHSAVSETSTLEDMVLLRKDLEASEEKRLKVQSRIAEILNQPRSEEDVSVLLDRLEEDMKSIQSRKLEQDLLAVTEERTSLRKQVETGEGKLEEAQNLIREVLETSLSVSTDGTEDVSLLLNHLQTRVQEEVQRAVRANEETAELQKELDAFVGEQKALTEDVMGMRSQLSDAKQQVRELLSQMNFTGEEGENLTVLLGHLTARTLEDKVSLKKDLEASEEKRLEVQKRIAEILNQPCSEEDVSVLLDRLEEDMKSMQSHKLEQDLLAVTEEQTTLRKQVETGEGKLEEAQRLIRKVLETSLSVSADETEDISLLLNHLQTRVQEEVQRALKANEETAELQKELDASVGEQKALTEDVMGLRSQLSDAKRQVRELLSQMNFTGEGGEDLAVLLGHLTARTLEDMVSLRKDLETKQVETGEGKLEEAQRLIRKVLENSLSVSTDETEDVSLLLNHVQTRVQEEVQRAVRANEETDELRRELEAAVGEQEALKEDVMGMRSHLSNAKRQVHELLSQMNFTVEGGEDLAVLLGHLTVRTLEDKASLRKDLEASEEKCLVVQSRITEILNQPRSEEDVSVLLDRLEEDMKSMRANGEMTELQKELDASIGEQKALTEDVMGMRSQLSDAKRQVNELLSQMNFTGEGGEDLSVLLSLLTGRTLEDMASLRKDLEASEEKRLEVQSRIAELLHQPRSEEDISVLLDRLEVDMKSTRANEETAELRRELDAAVGEQEALKEDLMGMRSQLSDAKRQVCELLTQMNFTSEGGEDLAVLLGHLTARTLEDKFSLRTDLEASKEKCLEVQSRIAEILNQPRSEEDVSVLLDRLEEDMKSKRANEETAELRRELDAAVGEQETLKEDLMGMRNQLSDAKRQVCELLTQMNFTGEGGEDLAVLLGHLTTRTLEDKSSLRTNLEASEKKRLEVQGRIAKILNQPRSEEDVSILLDRLEEDMKSTRANEETADLRRELDAALGEQETLKEDVMGMRSQLSEAKRQVRELLSQINFTGEGSEDIAVLLGHLTARTLENTMWPNASTEDQPKTQITINPSFENLQGSGIRDGASGDTVGRSGVRETDDKCFQQELCQKEATISSLRAELSHLQDKMADVEENTKQIEILNNGIKEKGERLNKMKAVAVKAKKELDNSKKEVSALKEELSALKAEREKMLESMKDVIHGAENYKSLLSDYDKQTEMLYKEKEKLEAAEKLNADVTKCLQVAADQHKHLLSEKEVLKAQSDALQSNVWQLEAQCLEISKLKSALEKELEAAVLLTQQKNKDYECCVKEVEELQTLVNQQKQQLQITERNLEQLRKDAQQSTLLDMEMADYERLVKELNQQLSEKDKLLEERENHIQIQRKKEEELNQEIESLKSLVDAAEEKASKMKQLLVKTKKDLTDSKKEEASQMIIQASLKGELEATQQQLEEYKIQSSDVTADRHKVQEQLRTLSDQHQKMLSSFQQQVASLQSNLNTTQAELESTVSEFESYKVRVHNVLKQQKTRSSTLNDGDLSKQDREHMESLVAQLRAKLQESQLSLQNCNAELQQLQTEHDTLLERHNKMLQQTVTKEAELRERLLALHSENVSLKSEHSQSMEQLTAQSDTLRSSFRDQLHKMQEDHRVTVETLQHQIHCLESQLFQLQKESSSVVSAPLQHSRKPLYERKLTDLPVFELNMAREEGEGMETTDTAPVTPAGAPLSLEQLLTSPDPKHEPFVWEAEPSVDELAQKLSTATRSMEHVNSLLHESEATNAVLMEQISLLKSELRRLERNQERERSVANLEYLKNVLLQFMFLRAGSEKQALLPVIHTMLQLSPEEKSKLAAIAQGEEEAAAARGTGWTSYLHSWSGIR